MAQSLTDECISIEYQLSDLPTPFHKAGLAGLLLLIESLQKRGELSTEGLLTSDNESATIHFSDHLLTTLMNDLYGSRIVEARVKSKWPGATLKREEVVEEIADGKPTKTKYFFYDVVQPVGEFFVSHYPDGDGLWLKLWRDMLWNIPRSRPTTRIPYNSCAENGSCREGESAWNSLVKMKKCNAKGISATEEISSALLLGAQAVNAENVPFVGLVEQNLLLHFWPIAVLIYVPMSIDSDGSSEFAGYSLAIPEVARLNEFIADYRRLLEGLDTGLSDKQKQIGYRPRRAVIDLPAESALAFMSQMAQLVSESVTQGGIRYSIRSVEYMHLVKLGNNVKTMSSGRIAFNADLIHDYRSIVRPTGKEPIYFNPLFRRGLIAALLDEVSGSDLWYRAFSSDLQRFDTKVLIGRSSRNDADDAKQRSSFASDAARKLNDVLTIHLAKLERFKQMPEPPKIPNPPAVILNRVVRSYLFSKTKGKPGIDLKKYEDEKGKVDWKKVPDNVKKKFNEEKKKIAESLFLEFRSRRDQAFVDHFGATFFSVTQQLSDIDRLELADLLIVRERRDDLKTLALLALSANS